MQVEGQAQSQQIGEAGQTPTPTPTPAATPQSATPAPESDPAAIQAREKEIRDAAFAEAKKQFEAERDKKAAEEAGEFEKLYLEEVKKTESLTDEVKKLEVKVERLEDVVDAEIKAKSKALPKDIVDLMPSEYDKVETLAWLSKAAGKYSEGKLNYLGENPGYAAPVDDKKLMQEAQIKLQTEGLYQN